MSGRKLKPIATAVLCAFGTSAAAFAEGATSAGTFGTWGVYTSEGQSHKICFAAAPPDDKKPATANRATALVYVTAWPKDGVKAEVSVKLGYPIKKGSTVLVTIGKDEFKLFSKDERAYIETANEDKLVEAMKKGSTMVVKASSERGTETTDTYSLTGIGQALDMLASKCS